MSISVICVYNDVSQLREVLEASLRNQNCEYEYVPVDNTNHQYSSAAEALNAGAAQSSGEYLVFIHQDIRLKEEDTLRRFSEALGRTQTGDVVGTQGVRDGSKVYYQNLTAGDSFDAGIRSDYPEELIEVSCFDEGMFGMRRETWERHHFDEVLCDSWHLYAVEQCLYARKNGHKAYVFPSQIHHFSYGHISIAYMQGLKRLCKAYRKEFRRIWTTCYKVYTNPVYINSLVIIWRLNRKIRGKSLH